MTAPTTARALERRRRKLQAQLANARDAYGVAWYASEAAEAEGLDHLAEAARRVLSVARGDLQRLEQALFRLPVTAVRVVCVDHATGAAPVALEVPLRGDA